MAKKRIVTQIIKQVDKLIDIKVQYPIENKIELIEIKKLFIKYNK